MQAAFFQHFEDAHCNESSVNEAQGVSVKFCLCNFSEVMEHGSIIRSKTAWEPKADISWNVSRCLPAGRLGYLEEACARPAQSGRLWVLKHL